MSESVQTIPPFVQARPAVSRPLAARPTTREWIRHSALFLLTLLTTTFAGIVIAAPDIDVPEPIASGVLGYLLYFPEYYWRIVSRLISLAILDPSILIQGLTFSVALLTILTAHEMGHYLACRYYGVDATLPFFIPAPPLFLAGTFGAFIKMKSPIPSRRALFDIGLAGPLAGFVILLPIAWAGIMNLHVAPPLVGGQGIVFNDPALFRIFAKLTGANLADALPNPLYMAAWIGLLVTSLNLMPVGQLDGGHGTFALFGRRAHKLIGWLAFVTMALIAVLGFVWHGSPSGFLYTVLLAIMLKVRHPAPDQMEPLGTARTVVAIITLIVFALSFWPFPITIT
ncbi:MAG TPA: site-2 protease family protein [Blastocatellia bacterium]|jgi:membrane-associated protease RseP (regulator of RpoE activity)|nr:site-2 protease family protein [Blastocatellia bacterium]HAF24310.1 site-2 protease family protein [Blastocatellia bacterium]HCX31666.1 site-2 protease family protein [Blastocatellia bacterium]